MRFLIKAAFWLGIVVLFMPMPESLRDKNTANISTADAIAFLSTAYADVKGFCARNPDACVTGTVAVQHFGQKAEYGSKILHDFISTKVEDGKDMKTAKAPAAKGAVNQAARAAQDTLKADDLAPGYREPKVSLSQL